MPPGASKWHVGCLCILGAPWWVKQSTSPQRGLRVPFSSSRTLVQSIHFFLFSSEFSSLDIDSQNQRTLVKSCYLGAMLELPYCPQMGLRVPSSSSRMPVQSIDFSLFSTEFLSLEIKSQNPRTPMYSGYLDAILESFFATMGPSWGHLGTTWGQIGSTLGCEHQSAEQHTF